MAYDLKTVNGRDFWEGSSSFQKAVRRGDEEEALYWAVEFYDRKNLTSYIWNRMFVMVSEDIGLANPQLPQQIWSLYGIYEHFKSKNNKHEPEKLHYIHAVLLLVRSPKSRLVDWALIHAFRGNHDVEQEVKDYALDKHTRRGKQKGRGFKHFFEEGAKLENHVVQENEDKYMESSRKILIDGNPDGVLFPEE